MIVPTRDRPEQLRRCLDALAAQQFSDDVDVIVVDDGSKDPEAVAGLVKARANARLIRLPGSGSPAARNVGVAASRAPYICFTDDDCVPDTDWLATMRRRLTEGAAVVAGRTINGLPLSALAAASQLVSNAVFELPAEPGAPSSSLACRRPVALAVKFDEGYAGIAAEERDWYARLRKAGYEVMLEPSAAVRHIQAPSAASFLLRHVRYGRGAYRFRRAHRGARIEAPSFYTHVIRAGFAEGVATGFAVCLAQIATTVGFVLEMLARRATRT